MKRVAALLLAVILIASVFVMGCKGSDPEKTGQNLTPDEVKAKMQSGGCNKGEVMKAKAGDDEPAGQKGDTE